MGYAVVDNSKKKKKKDDKQQKVYVYICIYVIVKSHYEEVIVVITRVRGGAKDECNNYNSLRVQWDLTGFYPIVFDVHHVTQ